MTDIECGATDRGHVCSHPAGHERWHQELTSGYRWKDESGVTACTPNPTGAEVPWEPFKDCTEECAVPVPCPTCYRDLPPRGRSVPMEHYLPSCCETARYQPINTRHIWDVTELRARRSVGINEPETQQ